MTTKLQAAARAVIERWDSPLWKDLPATGESISALRDALAREEALTVDLVEYREIKKRNRDVIIFEEARMATAREAQTLEPVAALQADMYWNNDDAEQQYSSIDELLNDEICNGSLAVGDVRTVQQATRLPNIQIKITNIDDESCDAAYEVIGLEVAKPVTPIPPNSIELKSGEREALLSRMPQLNYNNHSQGEVEDLITWANEAFDMLAANQIDALAAKRYNWLRDQHWAFDTLVVTTPDNVVIHSLCPSLSSLDMTIDAEIKAAKKVSRS